MELFFVLVLSLVCIAQLVVLFLVIRSTRVEKQELVRAIIAKSLAELDQKDVSLEYYNTLQKTTPRHAHKQQEKDADSDEWVDADEVAEDDAVISRVQENITKQ